MRDYEVVYIFKSSLTTEEIEARLEGYHAKILAADESEITAVEHWGKRQLAYPIDRNDNGYYVVTQFTASPSVLPVFERALKLDDDLLRHLVVLSEGELPLPSMGLADPDDDEAPSGGGADSDEDENVAADSDASSYKDENVGADSDADSDDVTVDSADSDDDEED